MVGRLVIDALWRNRWFYVVAGVMLLPMWLLFGVGRPSPLPISITAVSLILVTMLGPMFAVGTVDVRELRHLPVTARDVWRTMWVLATVVSAGILLATKMTSALLVAANGGSPGVSIGAMLLSALFDFAWASLMLTLLPWLGYGGRDVSRDGRLAAALAPARPVMAAAVYFGLPILISIVVPNALIALLAIVFGALAWTPRRSVLGGERIAAQRSIASSDAATRTRPVDRLTGIARVILPQLLATLALPVGVCLVLASYGAISGSGLWWFVPPAPDMFDPADTGDRGVTYFVLLPCAVVTMQGLWTPWARLLKALPVSVRQINALLLLTPFATWAVLWLLGWIGYALAYGTPRTLAVGLAFSMAAIGALAHAILLRVQGSTAFVWVVGAIGGLLPQLVKVGVRASTIGQVVFVAVCAIALFVAAFINHRTLTRSTSSSRAYRRPQPPFGMPAKPGF